MNSIYDRLIPHKQTQDKLNYTICMHACTRTCTHTCTRAHARAHMHEHMHTHSVQKQKS